ERAGPVGPRPGRRLLAQDRARPLPDRPEDGGLVPAPGARVSREPDAKPDADLVPRRGCGPPLRRLRAPRRTVAPERDAVRPGQHDGDPPELVADLRPRGLGDRAPLPRRPG